MLRSIFVHLISVYDRVNAPRLIRAEIISRISAVPHSVRQKNIWQVNCFIICLNYYFYLHSIIFIPHAGILMYSPFFTQIPVKSSVPSAGLNCTSCSWLEYLNPCIMDLLLESNPHTPDLFYKPVQQEIYYNEVSLPIDLIHNPNSSFISLFPFKNWGDFFRRANTAIFPHVSILQDIVLFRLLGHLPEDGAVRRQLAPYKTYS